MIISNGPCNHKCIWLIKGRIKKNSLLWCHIKGQEFPLVVFNVIIAGKKCN